MNYKILACKFRPKNFSELIGQEHITRALSYALEQGKLHHALIFSGTRGIGKTSVARILAKAINCEKGISPNPCDKCSSCVEINKGIFIDLIEVDAASRTRVEDIIELLDAVSYIPTKGRFKAYIIDEVHMLSTHSFNALLKTLEEPPPHVKFFLATTEVTKLPLTVISRCLHFKLKLLPSNLIIKQLELILNKEDISYELNALKLIARVCSGSMRDALSLLEQAIASGVGYVNLSSINDMLGIINQEHIIDILKSLAYNDTYSMLNNINIIDKFAPDYMVVLEDLLSILQKIAILQALPYVNLNELNKLYNIQAVNFDNIIDISKIISPEDIQIFYQIALLGLRDLPLLSNLRSGFEMILLRMICFRLENSGNLPHIPLNNIIKNTEDKSRESIIEHIEDKSRESIIEHIEDKSRESIIEHTEDKSRESIIEHIEDKNRENQEKITDNSYWLKIVNKLNISGITKQLALHCNLNQYSEGEFLLSILASHSQMLTKNIQERLKSSIEKYLNTPIKLNFQVIDNKDASKLSSTTHLGSGDNINNTKQNVDEYQITVIKKLFNATLTGKYLLKSEE